MAKRSLNPDEILSELAGYSLPDLREYLTILFTHYTVSDDWENGTDKWKTECMVNFRVLMRHFEDVQKWDESKEGSKNFSASPPQHHYS